MIENQEVIEAVSKPHDGASILWQYIVGGVAIVVGTLSGLVGMFYRSIETRNAKDIAALTALNEKLAREIEDLKKSQSNLMVENAVLKSENQTLRDEVRSLESRLTRYEQGSK